MRPLQKVNSLLHISKLIEIVCLKFPIANIELGWLMRKNIEIGIHIFGYISIFVFSIFRSYSNV